MSPEEGGAVKRHMFNQDDADQPLDCSENAISFLAVYNTLKYIMSLQMIPWD